MSESDKDWYGKPKPCPGIGNPTYAQFTGELRAGARVYDHICKWCGREWNGAMGAMPEHTFVPVRAEDFVFKEGKFFYGIETSLDAATVDHVLASMMPPPHDHAVDEPCGAGCPANGPPPADDKEMPR